MQIAFLKFMKNRSGILLALIAAAGIGLVQKECSHLPLSVLKNKASLEDKVKEKAIIHRTDRNELVDSLTHVNYYQNRWHLNNLKSYLAMGYENPEETKTRKMAVSFLTEYPDVEGLFSYLAELGNSARLSTASIERIDEKYFKGKFFSPNLDINIKFDASDEYGYINIGKEYAQLSDTESQNKSTEYQIILNIYFKGNSITDSSMYLYFYQQNQSADSKLSGYRIDANNGGISSISSTSYYDGFYLNYMDESKMPQFRTVDVNLNRFYPWILKLKSAAELSKTKKI